MLINDVCTGLHIVKEYIAGRPYDLIHITWYKPFYLTVVKKLCRKAPPKVVMTIHDLIHQMKSDEQSMYKRGADDMSRMIQIADGIVVVSDHTKKDLLQYYPFLKSEDIDVVYPGFFQIKDDRSMVNQRKKDYMYEDYILYVGQRGGYKNFSTFVEASEILKKIIPGIKVICAGGGSFSAEEEKKFKQYNLEGCFIQKYMSDEELSQAYRYAKCFVFPSLYEGFGVTTLEAFSNGCPVVMSDASCFPEVAQDAVLYCDGNNAADMAKQIKKYFDNEELRKEMIERGYRRLKHFSWSKAADEMLEFYKKTVGLNSVGITGT